MTRQAQGGTAGWAVESLDFGLPAALGLRADRDLQRLALTLARPILIQQVNGWDREGASPVGRDGALSADSRKKAGAPTQAAAIKPDRSHLGKSEACR